MDVLTVDVNDDEAAEQILAIHQATHDADQPDNPPPSPKSFIGSLRHPMPGEDHIHKGVRVDGRFVGHLHLSLPTLDNLNWAFADVTVDPRYRRRGIGRTLMEYAIAESQRLGRTDFGSSTLAGVEDGLPRSEAGRRFLESLGMTLALVEINRRTDLTAIDPQVERELYDKALAASTGYETVAWTGRPPEELLEPLAKLNSTFLTEIPLGELELEPEKIDADRMRKNDDAAIARGLSMCGVVARPIGSTQIVANTVIGLRPAPYDTAGQWMTIVSPEHRGHRLGLRIKLENHRQLRETEPRARYVITGNADVNDHMIAINEALGFQVIDAGYEYQRKI